jgi:hypothetical protein
MLTWRDAVGELFIQSSCKIPVWDLVVLPTFGFKADSGRAMGGTMADNQRQGQTGPGQERNPNNPSTQQPGKQNQGGEHSGQRQSGQTEDERNREREQNVPGSSQPGGSQQGQKKF